MQAPEEFTWVKIPRNQPGTGMFDFLSNISQGMFPVQMHNGEPSSEPVMETPHPDTSVSEFREYKDENTDDNTQSKSSSVKEDSVKRKVRRTCKREADQEARRRVEMGLKPYEVQVRPSGIIDSGCQGHLKWQEYVRDLTPRMLDMSVIKYDEQEESSRDKLRETMFKKFEFLDNEVSDVSFDKMIRTWIRRDRERVRRIHGGKSKGPSRYSDNQWRDLNKYWNFDAYKAKSEKMSVTRSKVGYNPRVGRHGYAGSLAKLVSELSHLYLNYVPLFFYPIISYE